MPSHTSPISRRSMLQTSAAALAGASLAGIALGRQPEPAPAPPSHAAARSSPLFTISLAQWSLHRELQSKKLDNLDFPRRSMKDFGIDAVEYVNQFFMDKAKDAKYLTELKQRCDDLKVTSVLIMCDGEGALGDPDDAKRTQSVENHKKWVEAAKSLGCHSIRVNAESKGSWEDQAKLAADGLRRLCEFADPFKINVIVENHGGLSSNGKWLAETIKKVGHSRAGTLPDFGNFRISQTEEFDRYEGTALLMPYARGVSAKSYHFDEKGQGGETTIDYRKMLKIVLTTPSIFPPNAPYRGRIGIEYEGEKMSEEEGIRATKKLLERLRDELAADPEVSRPGATTR